MLQFLKKTLANNQEKLQLKYFWLLDPFVIFSLDIEKQVHSCISWKYFNCTSFIFQGQLKRQFKWTEEEVEKNWGGKTGIQQKIADKCRNLNKSNNKSK